MCWSMAADGNFRGTKFIDLKSIVDEALEYCGSQGFSPEHVVLLNHVGARYPNGGVKLVPGRDKSFSELIAAADDQCEVEWVDAEDPLFVLYTRYTNERTGEGERESESERERERERDGGLRS